MSSENVKLWRVRVKEKLVLGFNSKCGICGYNKCYSALDFHHTSPKGKGKSVADMIGAPARWDRIVVEVKKCICVCCRCHREIHAGILTIPENITRWDSSFDSNEAIYGCCIKCGEPKGNKQHLCYTCLGSVGSRIDWTKLPSLLKANLSKKETARRLGASYNSLRRHINSHKDEYPELKYWRPAKRFDYDWTRLEEYLKEGKTTAEIADIVGCSYTAVPLRIARHLDK